MVLRRGVTEFLGTLAVVFAVVLAATAVAVEGGEAGVAGLAVGLAYGLTTAVAMAALTPGPVHLNPAVTVGAFVTGRLGPATTGSALVGQVAGGLAGAGLARACLPGAIWEEASLGVPVVSSELGISTGQAVLLESLLAAVVVWVFLALADGAEGPLRPAAAVVVGLTVTAGVLAASSFSGGGLNPARAFGPAAVGGFWDSHWVFWVGPVAGGIVAAVGADLLSGRLTEEAV